MSQISLTDDEYIQYMTIDVDAKNSSGAKSNEATGTGDTKVTPLKKIRKTKKAKEDTKDAMYFRTVRVSSNPGVEGSKDGLMMRPTVTRKLQWPT